MSGRNSQVSRIYRVLSLLEHSHYGLSIQDLTDKLTAEGLEVSKRTVYRDLEALQAAGFPITEKGKSGSNGARWMMSQHTKVGQYLALSVRELMALYLGKNLLEPLSGTPFYQDLLTVFARIEERIGNKGQQVLGELSSELYFEPGLRWGLGLNPDIIDTIRAACTERHVLDVTYSSANSQTTGPRRLGPHMLYFAKGSLYLVAEDFGDRKVKVFSVPRVSMATMSEEAYDQEPIDVEEYFSSSFGVFHATKAESIVVEFHPPVAAYVQERRWHNSQTIIAKPGGSIELRLDVAVTPELIQWILGFGSHAMVLSPVSLAGSIKDQAQLILNAYNEKAAKNDIRRPA